MVYLIYHLYFCQYMNNKAIGERIRRKREDLNLSQEKVAEMVGIKQASYSRIEKGEVCIVNKHLEKIASVLDTTSYDLLLFYKELEDSKRVLEEGITARYTSLLKEKDDKIASLEKTIRDKETIIALLQEKISSLRQKEEEE